MGGRESIHGDTCGAHPKEKYLVNALALINLLAINQVIKLFHFSEQFYLLFEILNASGEN